VAVLEKIKGMSKKYLLSTGRVTGRVEYYILDLFRLYLSVYPGDIPGDSSIGFDFTITDTFKSDLADTVQNKVEILVRKISDQFTSGLEIKLESCELIDEKYARIVVSCNGVSGEEIVISLYNDYE
jgi:hypothetical protein